MVIQFAKKMGQKIWIEPDTPIHSDTQITVEERPSLGRTLLPILIPLFLIVCKAIVQYPGFPITEGPVITFIQFVGDPLIALFIAVFFCTSHSQKRRGQANVRKKGGLEKP